MPSSKTPQLVFHIGDPKTGTTSIQAVLKQGLIESPSRRIAPWIRAEGRLNALQMARTLYRAEHPDRARWFEELGAWLATCEGDLAIVTSEYFSRSDPERLRAALEAHLPDHVETTRVIGYVRPHASRYLSAFIQRSKSGAYLGGYAEFFERIKKQESLYYAPRFAKWRAAFGENFTLRPFLRGELRNGDVVADFFAELLGSDDFTLTDNLQENLSLSERNLSGLRLLHRRLNRKKLDERDRTILAQAIYDHHLVPDGAAKPALDRATAQALIDTYMADAQALDAAFFSGPLMETDLRKSLDKAAETPIDLKPARHFGPADRKKLAALADEIAGLVLKDPELSAVPFRKAPTGGDAAARRELEARLAEFAAVLSA